MRVIDIEDATTSIMEKFTDYVCSNSAEDDYDEMGMELREHVKQTLLEFAKGSPCA